MFSARLLGAVLVLAGLCGPVQAVPLGEFTHLAELHAQALQARVEESPTRTWGEQLALKDLAGLRLALNDLSSLFAITQNADQEHYTVDTLVRLVNGLAAARQRFRNSASMLAGDGGAGPLLAQVEKLERRLKKIEENFSGRALPTRQRLASLDIDGSESLPYYDSPQELLREARGLRLNLQTLRNPARGRGMFSWGTASQGSDLQALYQAAFDYEATCGARYGNVVETRRDFERLQKAYDRIGPYNDLLDSAGWRDIGRSLERLARFYGSL